DSTGATLYALGDAPQRPASTEKIVTALATLDLIDPQTRFATRVMSTAAGHIVLVGGGDPMLTSNPTATYPAEPSTEELAVATAAALTKQGVTQVTLGYDGSLFSGPGRHPSWTPNYDWGVTTVSGLMVDHGIGGGPEDRRQPDPSAVAGQHFAAQLRAHGIQVDAVTPEVTPASATEVARVSSMPVGLIIQQALLNSDNDAAEALFRQVAIAAGRPGTFTDAAAVVQERLAAHGLWQDGTVITDGCGLGRDSRIRPAQLAGMVRLALSDARYRPLLDGLPVAGALGTLKNRFTVPQALPGRGDVRGKTGTLNDTANLAGYAVTADGAIVTFAFLSTEGNNDRGEVWIDASAGTLAACGCGS
ncbi:MAG: D-alanyl-D-alanine carboxypeptidase/D-alanyl-D-alanine-endopeptidase, partial [Propionibacteriaceae bacterium]